MKHLLCAHVHIQEAAGPKATHTEVRPGGRSWHSSAVWAVIQMQEVGLCAFYLLTHITSSIKRLHKHFISFIILWLLVVCLHADLCAMSVLCH